MLLDGGVLQGTAVLMALALGARAVLIGQPVPWGLAVGGGSGACDVLELLRTDLALKLMLCDLAARSDAGRSLLVAAGATVNGWRRNRSSEATRRCCALGGQCIVDVPASRTLLRINTCTSLNSSALAAARAESGSYNTST
jgi:hypothetical protein